MKIYCWIYLFVVFKTRGDENKLHFLSVKYLQRSRAQYAIHTLKTMFVVCIPGVDVRESCYKFIKEKMFKKTFYTKIQPTRRHSACLLWPIIQVAVTRPWDQLQCTLDFSCPTTPCQRILCQRLLSLTKYNVMWFSWGGLITNYNAWRQNKKKCINRLTEKHRILAILLHP